MTKPKKTQPQTKEVQGRDLFQTPNYAVDLLIPYIPKNYWVWECAFGEGKILNVLTKNGFTVYPSDIRYNPRGHIHDFLLDELPELFKFYSNEKLIITNPPFSLKYKFIDKAIEYDLPFAFLIPFDMCNKMAHLFMDYGCQGLVPTRRIDYITPTGLSGKTGNTSYYHSFWITRYFNLPQQLTFVELSLKEKENI